MKLKVVAWNMDRTEPGNWAQLVNDPDLAGAHIGLLCEATGLPAEPKRHGLEVMGNGTTKGLDCLCEVEGDRCEKRRYSTAVVSPNALLPMPADTRSRWGRTFPFEPSRPGSWTAARVEIGEITITAVALYGLNDEAYPDSVHRSLSELSPVFDHEEYGKYLVLGGDLNILAAKPARDRPYRGHLVLERIKAFGLKDCLVEALSADRYSDPAQRIDMDNCRCGRAAGCTHTRTFYRATRPDVPYQDDYLFASPALAGNGRLKSCIAVPVHAGSPSDHAPIVAVFEV